MCQKPTRVNSGSDGCVLMVAYIAGVRMRKVALLLLILFSFGPPFIYGFVGAGVFASLGWSAGIAMFAVGTGWRLPGKGVLASVLIGMCYAAAAHLPIFFIGRWIGK